MSDLFVELTAPNGRKYQQPRGLFINNEFVKSKSGETISSINPRYVTSCGSWRRHEPYFGEAAKALGVGWHELRLGLILQKTNLAFANIL